MTHHTDPHHPLAGASCAQIGIDIADELFFPRNPQHSQKAIALCGACVVREECLTLAAAEEGGATVKSRFGIRGGMTATQRLAAELDRPMEVPC